MSLISNLVRLHQVDGQVRALRGRLESAERYLAAQLRQLEELGQLHAELEQRKRHTEAVIANHELETRAIDERIEKLRDELNSAATTKQYNALLSELDTVKQQRSGLEDQTLAEMEAIEGINVQIGEAHAQITERTKVRDVAEQQLQERRNDVGESLEELERERAEASSLIPGEHLAVFDEVARVYDGESMATIDEIDRRHRDYACGACHMTVPFEHISVLASGNERLVRCTACGRILFMMDELKGELVKD